mmetsp:Transcript_21008/g.72574  ORF Transcript_21008/g.72574 Transcript_21008/m.72574 type:complete len:356 (+) Transcript_21008:875-1942(+)
MFGDEWIDKEENGVVADLFFRWLGRHADAPALGTVSAATSGKDPKSKDRSKGRGGNAAEKKTVDESGDHANLADSHDYARVPDVEALASRLRACLQENDELPRNFTKLFNDDLFRFDTDVVPEVVQLYELLHVKHEALSLIPPSFEYPLPPLQPATFPPSLREPSHPPLDQFDLDEHFASKRERLAQLTNKCAASNDDVEYYVREAGEVLGATQQLVASGADGLSAKHVLAFILGELVSFKKVNLHDDAKESHERRADQAEAAEAPSVENVLGSSEPVRRRQQLSHLDGPGTKLGDERPGSRGGLGGGLGGLGGLGADDFKAGARAPLRAFGADNANEDAPAEAKESGAEVMSFK